MSSALSKIVLLFLILPLCSVHISAGGNISAPCFPADAAALLRLKRSFFSPNLTSWRSGTDCCSWEAVACDAASGRVAALDLGYRNLRSRGLDPSLFNLTALRNLTFAGNDFMGARLPSAGFEQLTEMVHLDFSSTNFAGQIPTGIAHLKNLVTLDFYSDYGLYYVFLKEPNFEAFISNLSCLRVLSLDGVDISSRGETWSIALAKFTPRLQMLSLCDCDLSGTIHHSFSRLRSLVNLELSGNAIAGKIPEFFAEFPALRILDLSDNDFEGKFPTEIFQLRNLTVLFVFSNPRLSGHLVNFPVENTLEMLILHDTNFSDAMPVSIVNLKSLMSLALTTEGTSKQLSLIGKLPSLQELTLYGLSGLQNPQFSWIGDLTLLTRLVITNYNFSEPIPSWIRNLTNLKVLELTACNFYGRIPSWIGNLSQLSSIDFSGNCLTGTMKLSSFWRLKNLCELNLSNNMMSVIDDEDDYLFSSLPQIRLLELASCNLTRLPGMLKYLDGIEMLDLSNNHIHGAVPSWLWENCNTGMFYLNLSQNMFTSLEKFPSIIPMVYTYILDLSSNRLEGDIPVIPIVETENELISPKTGGILDCSNNYFSSIPQSFGKYLKQMTYLDLSKNKLNGHVPTSVCSASRLEILDLSYNYFRGLIPFCLTQNSLRVLKLRGNRFQEELPDNIREGCMLDTIDLSSNYISGKLPRSLSNCQELRLLDVGNNQIVDSFPSWMRLLPKLRVLVLRSNQFFGMIRSLPENVQIMNHFSSLQILNLASNNFSGNLPEGWFTELRSIMATDNDVGQAIGHETKSREGFYQDTVTITFKGLDIIFTKILTTMKVIDLSNNSFDGPIPKSVGKLVALHGLNMSYNNFTEQIPSQLDNLSRLESLDLSWNHLSGEIPQELTFVTSLAWLNLSYNNLTGRIPQENQFLSFPSDSFEGNPGLCGSQVSKPCDILGSTIPRASDHPESNSLWQCRLDAILLFTFVGLGFGVGFALAIMFLHVFGKDGWNCMCQYIIHS